MHTNVQTYKSDPGLKPFRGVNAKLLYLMHSLIALLLPNTTTWTTGKVCNM